MSELSFSMLQLRRTVKRMRLALYAICCLIPIGLASVAVQAQSQPACGLPNFPAPELCVRAGLDTVPASYLFIVDESGSMRPLWDGVVSALVQFSAAVPDGSELDVRLFSTTLREVIPATRADDRTRQLWGSQLRSLSFPSGQHTDLGLAARAAIKRVGSAPPDQLQFVFFLTDGVHDPGPSSPFARQWDQAWEELAQEAHQLGSVRPLRVSVVRLSPAADVGLLTRIFPDAVVTDAMTTAALQQWFTNLTGEAAVSKLHLLLKHDLARPTAAVSTDGPVRTYARRTSAREVVFESRRRLITTAFPPGTEFSLPGGGVISLPRGVTLEPGARSVVTADIQDRNYLPILPPGVAQRSVSGSSSAPALLEPASELALIGASSRDTASVEFNLELAGGGVLSWPLWLLAVAILAVLSIYAFVRLRWAAHRAYLPGRVIVRHATSAGDSSAEETVMFAGRRLPSYMVMHPDGRSSIQLHASSERGRTVIYAEPAGQAVSIAGKTLTSRTQINRVTRFEAESGEITFLPN